MFDQTKPLGRVCPDILDSNAYEEDGWARMVLYLALDDDEFEELKQKLVALEGDMLLFTRRLRHIDAFSDAELLVSHDCQIAAETEIETIVTQRESIEEIQYVRYAKTFKNLPYHEKREAGISEVVLAFPFTSDGALIQRQRIFAFLPLRRTFFSVSSSFSFPDFVVPDTHRLSHTGQSRGDIRRRTLEPRVGESCFTMLHPCDSAAARFRTNGV